MCGNVAGSTFGGLCEKSFFDHTLTVLCIFRAGPDETVAGGNGRTAAGSFKGNQIAVVICFGKIDDICRLRDFVIGIGIVDIAQCTDDAGEQRENQQDHGEDHQPPRRLPTRRWIFAAFVCFTGMSTQKSNEHNGSCKQQTDACHRQHFRSVQIKVMHIITQRIGTVRHDDVPVQHKDGKRCKQGRKQQ